MIRSVRSLLLSALLPAVVGGCGGGNNASDSLGVTVLPANVILSASSMKTCSDLINQTTTSSAAAPAITFPKLRIDWADKTNFLIISSIRVTITGTGITGGTFATDVSGDELDNLLAIAQLQPNQFVDISHQTETDPRGKSRNLTPCRFTVGGIAINKGAPSFRANITIDVIGTSLSNDYSSQAFVKQTVRATADYIAY